MDISKVKDLRSKTQASYAECKKALEESCDNMAEAERLLMIKGLREVDGPPVSSNIGVIHSYVHPGNRIGVLVEVGCETDFVAKTEEFQKFVKEMALQVASMKPLFISRDEISESLIYEERERRAERLEKADTPVQLIEELVDAEMVQWYTEVCLLEQTYIRESGKAIKELLAELINKTGETCRIVRFSRWEVGQEELEEEADEELPSRPFNKFFIPAAIILAIMFMFFFKAFVS